MSDMKVRLYNNKVTLFDGKVGCRCCLVCANYDLDVFLYGDPPESEILLKQVQPSPDPPPVGGDRPATWRSKPFRDRRVSCKRWVCVDVSQGRVVGATQFGGPTYRALDLPKVLWEHTSVPEGTGSYLYRFDFHGWMVKALRGDGKVKEVWLFGSDTMFELYEEIYPNAPKGLTGQVAYAEKAVAGGLVLVDTYDGSENDGPRYRTGPKPVTYIPPFKYRPPFR